jgi:ABC-type multidrug transport system fused ATPase/permease subunit
MQTSEFATAKQIFLLLRRVRIHGGYFLVPVVLFLFTSALEGIGMGLLIPILHGFLEQDFSFIKDIPGITTILSFLSPDLNLRDRTLFVVLMGIFVTVILLKNILRYAATTSMAYLSTRALHHLRKQLFEAYLGFGKLYFDRSSIGHHSTVLSNFTISALAPVFLLDRFVHSLFSILMYIIVMCFISWKLTLIAIPLFVVLHMMVKGMILSIQHMSHAIAENASALGKKSMEILSTIPLVKAYNMEQRERKNYADMSDEGARLDFRSYAVLHLIHPLQEVILLFAVIALVAFMLSLLVSGDATTAPSFLVYFYLVLNIASRFGTLSGLRGNLAKAQGPVQEILHIFDHAGKEIVPEGKRVFRGLERRIAFSDVRFSYGGEREILRGLSFSVEKGKVTAIVGPTGAGKTTIISLLLRYYDCPSGGIFMDDTDIREFVIGSLRTHIALVSQETLLFHDSLRGNITYGIPGASEQALTEAVRRARLADFVQKLPHGLDTVIGDRGVKLSGGEKQRVSIARALLKGSEILILDEATSSLDAETERLIQEAMDDAMQGKTAIVIAHRLSTIRRAEKIIVIENGRCKEEGTLEELKAKGGTFSRLWEAQKFD